MSEGMANLATPGRGGPGELEYDRDLLRRIQQGTPEMATTAIDELMTYCRQSITAYVKSRGLDSDYCEDVIDDTCMYVSKHVNGFAFRGRPLSHWFSAIAALKVKEQRRIARRNRREIAASELPGADDDWDDHPFDLPQNLTHAHRSTQRHDFSDRNDPNLTAMLDKLTRQEADRLIHMALKSLPTDQRRIMMLIYFDEITTAEEVGAILKMDPGKVRVYHLRARRRLETVAVLKAIFDDLCFS